MKGFRMFTACYFLLRLLLGEVKASNFRYWQFTRETICNVEERRQRGCSLQVGQANSFLDCVYTCGTDTQCIGASEDEAGRCFHHQVCLSAVPCAQPDAGHRYVASYCVHGSWDSSTQTCVCVDGTSGPRCDKYPASCQGLLTAGYGVGQYYVFVDPPQDGLDPIKVFCDVTSLTRWTVILVYNHGTASFNRTWREYVDGFQTDFDHHWAGLRPWKVLGDAGCTTVIFALGFTYDSSYMYRRYENFRVSGEDTGYSFTQNHTISGHGNTPPAVSYVGDCFGPIQNTPFSTWDRDNDGSGGDNCASRAGSGWWYSGCNNPCNLLGYLDDYQGKSKEQRLSLVGMDMDQCHSVVDNLLVYMLC